MIDKAGWMNCLVVGWLVGWLVIVLVQRMDRGQQLENKIRKRF